MTYKGTRYTYSIVSKGPAKLAEEIDTVGNAFQNAGWIEAEIIPESGFPTHIVFEWTQDGRPIHPVIPLL